MNAFAKYIFGCLLFFLRSGPKSCTSVSHSFGYSSFFATPVKNA